MLMKINRVYRAPDKHQASPNQEFKSPWRNRNVFDRINETKTNVSKIEMNFQRISKRSNEIVFVFVWNFKYELKTVFVYKKWMAWMHLYGIFVIYPFTEYWIPTEWCVDTCNPYTWMLSHGICSLCVCVCVQSAKCRQNIYELHQLTKPRTYRTLIVVFYDNLHFYKHYIICSKPAI